MNRKVVAMSAVAVLGIAAVACSVSRQAQHSSPNEALHEPGGRTSPPVAQKPMPLPRRESAEQDALADVAALSSAAPLNYAPLGQEKRHVAVTAHGHPDPIYRPLPVEDRERYEDIDANPVKLVRDEPVSTFSIDVDTAAYANVRRFLKDGLLPPVDAVRIEELVNYFDYAYPIPENRETPFAADIALFDSPWDPGSQLLRIGIRGYEIEKESRPPANLVFLVDTSGSMDSPDKLPLLQRSFRMLVSEMGEADRIAIVAYAGSAGVVLEPTSGKDKAKILQAIDHFQAGGSTAGADGIRTAYQLAEASFDEAAVNRVILATDGDFNVGLADPNRLEDFIATKRKSGVYLSILGFGQGNLNDLLMQKLSQAGNGQASYIDSLMEARKVLVDEMGSTLFPIADDVKIQIEFNPEKVAEYRLIGYETRMLAREDFNNDKVDAGEIGSGHTVTTLYEITPPDSPSRLVDDLRYGVKAAAAADGADDDGELAWLRLRYKHPGESESSLIEQPVLADARTGFEDAPDEARFAAAVAAFGQILRNDPHVEDFDLDAVNRIAKTARGDDAFGYRSEFLQLVKLAETARALHPVN